MRVETGGRTPRRANWDRVLGLLNSGSSPSAVCRQTGLTRGQVAGVMRKARERGVLPWPERLPPRGRGVAP